MCAEFECDQNGCSSAPDTHHPDGAVWNTALDQLVDQKQEKLVGLLLCLARRAGHCHLHAHPCSRTRAQSLPRSHAGDDCRFQAGAPGSGYDAGSSVYTPVAPHPDPTVDNIRRQWKIPLAGYRPWHPFLSRPDSLSYWLSDLIAASSLVACATRDCPSGTGRDPRPTEGFKRTDRRVDRAGGTPTHGQGTP